MHDLKNSRKLGVQILREQENVRPKQAVTGSSPSHVFFCCCSRAKRVTRRGGEFFCWFSSDRVRFLNSAKMRSPPTRLTAGWSQVLMLRKHGRKQFPYSEINARPYVNVQECRHKAVCKTRNNKRLLAR